MICIDINSSISEVYDFLMAKNWLNLEENVLSIEKPGEGNMNVVLRVKTNQRSFIFKQSRPYVQKYQDIKAPLDRIDVEFQFYCAVERSGMKSYIPQVLAYDKKDYTLLLSDLGECYDMTYIYQDRKIDSESIELLVHMAELIHGTNVSHDYPENLALRQLNHQHIFVLPFLQENGFDLDQVQKGLQGLSMIYKKDISLISVIESIGERYLSKGGNTLIHGDYYPGSWMAKQNKIYAIDPEFSFVGFAEFDLGIMSAHLIMGESDFKLAEVVCGYAERKVDLSLIKQVAGIEIMRRIIGLAQLPLKRSIEEKAFLLKTAKQMILS